MTHGGRRRRAAIGLFHELEPPGVVVGRQVAVDAFVLALLRHGRRFDYSLYVYPRQGPEITKRLGRGPARGHVRDRRELGALGQGGFAAWHEPQFDSYASFALRVRSRSHWPITILHHSLSYKELLHASVLPLLLARPRRYDALVTTSSSAEKALRRIVEHVAGRFNEEHGTSLSYRGRFERIPLGVDTDRFRPRNRALGRSRFGLERDAFVLLWVGRLSAIDKADLLPLVRCFAELKRGNPKRKLRLVCAGSEHPNDPFGEAIMGFARRLGVGEAVTVLKRDERVEECKELLYAAADVFVSPVDNVQESFGLAPIEAMACGIPQIVADWNGYRDSVRHGETGFLVDTVWADCQGDLGSDAFLSDTACDHLALSQSVAVDMGALSLCIQRLMDEPALRKAMAAQSRRRALEKYAWPVVIHSYEALWAELSAEAKRAPGPVAGGGRYAMPDYGGFFRAYASREIGSQTALRLTAQGRRAAGQRGGLPSHYIDRWRHLHRGILERIMGALGREEVKGMALSVGQILTQVRGTGEAAAGDSALMRHVLFLVKYGLAEETKKRPGRIA